jgi:hypothetical protein
VRRGDTGFGFGNDSLRGCDTGSGLVDIALGRRDGSTTLLTALTIGYGDITPKTTIGHILSVLIGLIGMIFVGLIVAIASRALTETVKERHAAERETTR